MVNRLSAYIFLVFLFLISGCTTLYNPATGRKEFIVINSETEAAIGKSVSDELIKEHPQVSDAFMQSRLQKIGRRLAEVSDRKDIKYTFSILDDKTLNAVSLPGGIIYVNKGLIDILNDDELAYVVGHEVGHVAARHVAKKIQSNMAYQMLLAIAFASMPEAQADKSQNIAKGVDTVYSLIELGYSRQDEYQADRLAVKYVLKAKFDPYASLSALEKIKKEEGARWKILKYFRTHPYTEDRIKALRMIIPQIEQNMG